MRGFPTYLLGNWIDFDEKWLMDTWWLKINREKFAAACSVPSSGIGKTLERLFLLLWGTPNIPLVISLLHVKHYAHESPVFNFKFNLNSRNRVLSIICMYADVFGRSDSFCRSTIHFFICSGRALFDVLTSEVDQFSDLSPTNVDLLAYDSLPNFQSYQ